MDREKTHRKPRGKIHYLPLHFFGSKNTFCGQATSHGIAFSQAWHFVTCKNCLKERVNAERRARAMFRYGGIEVMVIDKSS